MASRHDRRRFGPGPYVLGLRRGTGGWGDGFPIDVPAVAAVAELRLDDPVTLLAGDDGTGKSTLIEASAEAIGFAADGGSDLAPDLSLYGDVPLHRQSHDLDAVRLTRGFLEAPERCPRAALEDS